MTLKVNIEPDRYPRKHLLFFTFVAFAYQSRWLLVCHNRPSQGYVLSELCRLRVA